MRRMPQFRKAVRPATIVLTNRMPYSKTELKQFATKVSEANLHTLASHLSDPNKACKVEGFQESQGKLYFKLKGSNTLTQITI